MKNKGIVNFDLFGNKVLSNPLLRNLFIEPPFSVLDSKTKSWTERKAVWNKINMKSEVSRNRVINLKNYAIAYPNANTGYNYSLGTSIFDPVLCEVLYNWFNIDGGSILDPFAGGCVRGVVAHYLGYQYTGIDIRKEQIESNRKQSVEILNKDNQPEYIIGNSNTVLDKLDKQYDMIFSCPPYSNLEVYSNLKNDISNMNYNEFIPIYKSIINKSVEKLSPTGMACFVVGNIRDKNGNYRNFINDTINAFIKSGMVLYNECIYLENGLNTAAMRSKKYMRNLKLVKVHQNILVFKQYDDNEIKTKFR